MDYVRFAGIAEVKKNLALAAQASMRAKESEPTGSEAAYVSKGEMQAHLKAAVIDPDFDRFMKHNEAYLKEPVDVIPEPQAPAQRMPLENIFKQPERLGVQINPEQTREAFKSFMSSLGTLMREPEKLGVKVYYHIAKTARFLESLEHNFKQG